MPKAYTHEITIYNFPALSKISSLMGDVAKGIKSFKKGMSDNPTQEPNSPPQSVEKSNDNNDNKDSENK